jgi:hypothetical protein
VREALDNRPGGEVVFIVFDGWPSSQRGTWCRSRKLGSGRPAWQNGEDEATRDIAVGRTAVMTRADEFFAELDR